MPSSSGPKSSLVITKVLPSQSPNRSTFSTLSTQNHKSLHIQLTLQVCVKSIPSCFRHHFQNVSDIESHDLYSLFLLKLSSGCQRLSITPCRAVPLNISLDRGQKSVENAEVWTQKKGTSATTPAAHDNPVQAVKTPSRSEHNVTKRCPVRQSPHRREPLHQRRCQ